MNGKELARRVLNITEAMQTQVASLVALATTLAGGSVDAKADVSASVTQRPARGQKTTGKAGEKSAKAKGGKGKAADKAETGASVAAGVLSATISAAADGRTRLPNGLFAEGATVKLTGPSGKSVEVNATADGRAKIGRPAAGVLGLADGVQVTFVRTGKGSKGVGYTVIPQHGTAAPRASKAGSGAGKPKTSGKGKTRPAKLADVREGRKRAADPGLDLFDALDLGPVAEEKPAKPVCAECGTVAVKKAGQTCARCKRSAKAAPAAAETPAPSKATGKGGKAKAKPKGTDGGKGSRPAALRGASKARREAATQVAQLSGRSLTEVAESLEDALHRHPTPDTTRVGK